MSTERRPCPRCGVEVIAGRTDNGFDVVLDDIALDADGELDAALAGTRTYTHRTFGDTIASRSPFQIRTAPAGTRPRVSIRPPHDCTPAPERTTAP